MKHITSVLLFFICVFTVYTHIPIPKVTTGAVVPLEEWTLIKGWIDSVRVPPGQYGIGSRFSYLPHFPNATGKSSIIMNYYDYSRAASHDRTWLFENPTDTVDRYSWKTGSSNSMIALDINGDRIDDYLSGAGLVLGRKDDYPDTSVIYNIHQNGSRAGSSKNTYGDMNDDGKADLFYYHTANKAYPYIISITFGGADVGKLLTTHVRSTVKVDSSESEVAVTLYRNKNGQWRLITYKWASLFVANPQPGRWYGLPEKAGINLYSVGLTTIGDSVGINLILIDTFRDADWDIHSDEYYSNNWSPVIQNGGGTIFNSSHLSSIYFYPYVGKVTGSVGNYSFMLDTPILDLTEDRFKQINSNGGCADCKVLDHSIDGDSVEDLARGYNDACIFYSLTQNEVVPQPQYIYQLPFPTGTLVNEVISVKDVSGDAINDVALLFYHGGNKPNSFGIIKGKNRSTVSVVESTSPTLSIESPFPQPSKQKTLVLPINIDAPRLYEMNVFRIDGKLIRNICSSILSEGRHTFELNTDGLSIGSYLIRLSDGIRVVDKMFFVTE